MFGMRLSITLGRRSAIAGQKRVGWRGRLGEGRVVTERPGQPQFVPPKRTHLRCRMVAAGLSGGLPEGSPATIPLQINGGPQGSRTPDLRRSCPSGMGPHRVVQEAGPGLVRPRTPRPVSQADSAMLVHLHAESSRVTRPMPGKGKWKACQRHDSAAALAKSLSPVSYTHLT